VAVLINNAGLTVDPPGLLHEVTAEQVEKIVALNVGAVTALTHVGVRCMLSRKERGQRSLVVSMGSFAARAPLPMLQVYSASKKYVEHLSAALAAEYSGRIDFVCGAPWWVATSMTRIRRANWRAVSPSYFVRGLLAYVGSGSWIDPVDPYPLHALCDVIVEAIPGCVVNKAVISFMTHVRSSFFRRQQREQQKQHLLLQQQQQQQEGDDKSGAGSKKDQ
jgi:short-subunit dehydrogenase